jgi:hypothetical protein
MEPAATHVFPNFPMLEPCKSSSPLLPSPDATQLLSLISIAILLYHIRLISEDIVSLHVF